MTNMVKLFWAMCISVIFRQEKAECYFLAMKLLTVTLTISINYHFVLQIFPSSTELPAWTVLPPSTSALASSHAGAVPLPPTTTLLLSPVNNYIFTL